MNKLLILFLLTTLGCLCINPIIAIGQQNLDSTKNKMDIVFKKYNNRKGPGCTVAVIKDGKIIFKKGDGMANLEYVANLQKLV
jgi:CubicO group peptidase (beta-lactamase class C family)